jgi:hypothetical protein
MKTKQDGKQLEIQDLKPASYNPRRIHPKAAKGLAYSMESYGDISGIVFNSRTGCLVCGHQRVDQGRKAGATMVDGALVMPNGERFPVRVVDWPIAKERAANVAANNTNIGGEWDEGIGAVLDSIKADILPEDFSKLCFDEILVQPLEEMPVLPSGEKSPYQQMTFTLHDDQAEQVMEALDRAKEMGAFVGTGNENSNGNALSRVCEMFLTGAN